MLAIIYCDEFAAWIVGTAGMRRPPLPPGQMPSELAALLAGGVPENPALFAETLAAAAKAQAHAQNQVRTLH